MTSGSLSSKDAQRVHHAKLIGLLAPIAWPTGVMHCKDGAEQLPRQAGILPCFVTNRFSRKNAIIIGYGFVFVF